ncbi:MAG: SpoIIE family protein phosphatase [Planctomycetota bacterium]
MDHLRLVWQTGETLLDSVVFDEDPEGTRYNVLLALQEMVTNVLRHGYQLDESKPIEVVFQLTEDQLQIELRDQGPEFDPLAYADDDDSEFDMGMPSEAGGYGIRIARMVMDDVEYLRTDGWNCLRLTKCVRVIANTRGIRVAAPGLQRTAEGDPRRARGVSVHVLDEAGAWADSYGEKPTRAEQVRVSLPIGELVAEVPAETPVHALVASLLRAVADRERLESDMDSMNGSALRLLEQVSMMGEALPKLSAGGDATEIAALGVRACHRAAGVERVVYLAGNPTKEYCEVVVHDAGEQARTDDVDLDPVQPVEGLLREILAAETVVLRSVPDGGHLGEPGSVEHLASRQVLGVPVTYGSGDKRVILGALVLIDRASSFGNEANAFEAELGNEEGQVAESFAAMLGAVLGARKVAELGKELSMAQTIQQQILPEGPVELDGFDVAAGYFACGAVGGDYFDYVPLADGRTMVVVADVSGHNLASGMVMVGARAMLRTLATVLDAPEQVFSQVAQRMHQDLTRTERFLTAAAVALRPNGRAVDYVSAGHNDLMVYRAATDSVERLESEDVILGFLPDPDYQVRQLVLEPGDCILLYTDGIPEAIDQNEEMFGEDRLSALFAQLAPNRTAQRILDGIVAELDRFRRGQVGTDDVTAVVIRCTDEGALR